MYIQLGLFGGRRHWRLALVLLAGLLGACGLLPARKNESDIVAASLAVIQQQQVLLAEHVERLESLAQTQVELVDQLDGLQGQLESLGKRINPGGRSEAARQVPVVKVVEAVAPRDEVDKNGAPKKAVLGRVEWLWLPPIKTYVKARVDTGAGLSSIHASDIQLFERNGRDWVSFVVAIDGHSSTIEAPVERFTRIRQASLEGRDKRPLVKLQVRVGELVEETEFTLTDRSEMIYPVLLGRSFLRDIAVVDVARKFTRARTPELLKLSAESAEQPAGTP